MTNILVSGGTGFIGSHLVHYLLKKEHNVVVIRRDEVPNRWVRMALEGATIIKGDILDLALLQRVLADYLIEEVYHLAAQAVLKSVVKDPVSTFNVNVIGCVNILEAVRRVNPKIKVLVQTTDKVYDWSKLYVTEKDALGSINGIYEASKVCEDTATRAYQRIYNLDIRITRPSNIYGYDLSSRIIPNTIKACTKGRQPVIYKGQESMLRNYLYVMDLVEGLELVMQQQGGSDAIYNIGSDDVLSQEQVVKKIAEKFDTVPVYEERDSPLVELQEQAVNWDKIKALGFKPKYSFDKGLDETIDMYRVYGW